MALGHPLIVTQCTGVAMRLGPVLAADEVVEQVIGVLDKLGVEQACVIGHSYGERHGEGWQCRFCSRPLRTPC
jgi:pimeloyl-ACP methyl ester carboxylesterase